MNLEAKALTDPGRERDMNEDRAWAQVFEASEGSPMGLFIVCDGMGGHLGGEVASHWAVEAIKVELADLFCQKDPRATVRLSDSEIQAIVEGSDSTRMSPGIRVESLIRKAIQKANQVVLDYAQKRPEKAAEAGATLTMAVVIGRRTVIANVGDSRTYLLRDHKLRQITQDHSLVASLVASGQIKPEEVFSHPQRNMIYRSLGQKRQIQIDTYGEVLEPGDYLLLCSDGLWEMVHDEDLMVRLIESANSLDSACKKLVDAANKAGGEDNISVVLAHVT
jgi:protein phosphatase